MPRGDTSAPRSTPRSDGRATLHDEIVSARMSVLGVMLVEEGAKRWAPRCGHRPRPVARRSGHTERSRSEILTCVFSDRAHAAIDRFTNNAYDLVIEGESYRRRLKPSLKKGGWRPRWPSSHARGTFAR